jgi:hypothetical protein
MPLVIIVVVGDRSEQKVEGRSVKTMHIQESFFVSMHEKTPILL